MENVRKEISKSEALKVLEEIESSGTMNLAEEMIKDNTISFQVNESNYRVRLMNFREKEELDTFRRKKFGQLLQDKDLMLEYVLIKVYKERGIDIADIDDKMRKLNSEMHDKKVSLGEALAKNEGEAVLKAYEEQINILKQEYNILYIQRNTLLEYSIENQLLNYVAELTTYLSTEIEYEEGNYKRLWKTYEDFMTCGNKELIDRAGVLSTLLQYSL